MTPDGIVRIYVTEFGQFPLPDQFPFYVFRKDGLIDRRRRGEVVSRAEQFIQTETDKLKAAYFA